MAGAMLIIGSKKYTIRHMSSYTFRTIIEPETGGGYHGFVPILKGVHTYGGTLKEIQANLKEAIKCHVEGLLKDKEIWC